jgi:hypothetical protein
MGKRERMGLEKMTLEFVLWTFRTVMDQDIIYTGLLSTNAFVQVHTGEVSLNREKIHGKASRYPAAYQGSLYVPTRSPVLGLLSGIMN